MSTGHSVRGRSTEPGVHAAVRVDAAPRGVAAVHVRPGVARILEHAQHPGVRQPAPAQLPGPHPAVGAQREPAAVKRGDHAVGRPARGEGREQITDRGRHLGVRVDDDRTRLVVEVADRQRGAQLAAGGRGAFGRVQALGHHVQLHLAHRGLQPEQHPVVDIGRIVDAVGVDQQRLGDRGELHQPRHLRVGAGQPRDLQPEDRADLARCRPATPARRTRPGPRPTGPTPPGRCRSPPPPRGPSPAAPPPRPARTGASWTRRARAPAPSTTAADTPPPADPDGRQRFSPRRSPPPPPCSTPIAMFATTCTASVRAAPANTTSDAAAGTGHRSSRRASSSALIAEISAITAATCSPRASHARTAATSPAGTYRARPRPAGFGVKYDVRAVRLSGRAAAPRPPAPAGLFAQRPHQHLLHVGQPARQPPSPRQQRPRRHTRQIVLV